MASRMLRAQSNIRLFKQNTFICHHRLKDVMQQNKKKVSAKLITEL